MTTPLRPDAAPEAGMRLAYGYALTLSIATVAGLLGSVFLSVSTPRVCGTTDPALGCFALLALGWIGATSIGLAALAAWWCRMGWAWVAASVALLLLLLEVVGNPFSSWMLLAGLVPALAAVGTDPSLPWLRWRRLAVALLTLATVGWFAYVLWDVTR